MRRSLAVLALFLLTTGFHHHHHHGSSSHGSAGCGGVHTTQHRWVMEGTVQLDATGGTAQAVIRVRDAISGAPKGGLEVTVNGDGLRELAPGTYLGAVEHVAAGETVTLQASGAVRLVVTGRMPQEASGIATSAAARTVTFDERGAATAITVVSHGPLGETASETTTSFDEDARIELPLPGALMVTDVELRVDSVAQSVDEQSLVTLETTVDAPVAAAER